MTAPVLLLFLWAAVSVTAVAQEKPVGLRTVANVRAGWWIRVDTRVTKAASIQWEIGTNQKKLTDKATWSVGGPAEIELPESVRKESVIQIQALTAPAAAPAGVCVFYGQQGVAGIEFTGTAGRQLNQKMKESKCRPCRSRGVVWLVGGIPTRCRNCSNCVGKSAHHVPAKPCVSFTAAGHRRRTRRHA